MSKYHIHGLNGPPDHSKLGGWGFSIQLWPEWKRSVAASGLTQEKIDHAIKTLGRRWLDVCGYDEMTDPDAPDPMAVWEHKHLGKPIKLGPRAHKLYEPWCIRISWGEWGPEHINSAGQLLRP